MNASFRLSGVAPGFAQEARHVVQAEEGHELRRIGVQVVAAERARHLAQLLPLTEGAPQREEQREVEERVDPGVDAVEARSTSLEERHQRRVAVEELPHHAQPRVLALDRRHPGAPEAPVDVGQRVLADSVEAAHAHPPERVLDDVAGCLLVVLVEVGQHVDEPACECRLLGLLGGVRVGERPDLPGVGEVLLLGPVEPGRRRRVLEPVVVGPRVVGHLVLDQLEAARVGGVDQLAQLGHVPEALVDGVEVLGVVAVVARHRLAVRDFLEVEPVGVVVDRVEPDRGDAQVLQVREPVDHPLQVAAVKAAGLGAVEQVRRARARVVGGIAVREAVGHDQVDHVVGREPLEAALARKRREQLERDRARARPRSRSRASADPAPPAARSSTSTNRCVPRGFTRTRPSERPEPAAASTRAPASSRPRSISRTGSSECPGHQLGGSTLSNGGRRRPRPNLRARRRGDQRQRRERKPCERRRSVAHGDGSSLLGLGLRNPQREGRRQQQRDAAEQQRPRGIVAEPV